MKYRSILIYIAPEQVIPDSDCAFLVELPDSIPLGDHDGARNSSMIRVLEDGKEIGPAHSNHDDIRQQGRGLYSHWERKLWFSSSDDSSPRTNGRQYHIFVPAEMFMDVDRNSLVRALTIDIENLADFQKFLLARELFRSVWPHSRLPDIGRRIDEDDEFESEFRRHKPESDLSYERTYNLDQLSQLALKVPGDIAECGTYKGGSAFFLARRILQQSGEKRLHLFDSFKGLSQPSQVDGTWWQKGDLASRPEDVTENLKTLSDTTFVKLYPGWIPDRFDEIAAASFCFVHVDVDLYQPTFDCLAFFYPRLNKGGVMLFDDYGHKSCPGVTKALNEFIHSHREPIINLAAGGAFIIKE